MGVDAAGFFDQLGLAPTLEEFKKMESGTQPYPYEVFFLGLVGEIGVVRTPLAPEGQVLVHGELWKAIAQNGPAAVGEKVEVVGVDGLTLTVVKAADRR